MHTLLLAAAQHGTIMPHSPDTHTSLLQVQMLLLVLYRRVSQPRYCLDMPSTERNPRSRVGSRTGAAMWYAWRPSSSTMAMAYEHKGADAHMDTRQADVSAAPQPFTVDPHFTRFAASLAPGRASPRHVHHAWS
jgi:hypothetical protein